MSTASPQYHEKCLVISNVQQAIGGDDVDGVEMKMMVSVDVVDGGGVVAVIEEMAVVAVGRSLAGDGRGGGGCRKREREWELEAMLI
ncbi:hypothetical protein Tco_1134911 [Tanacetum coccineum]